MKTPNRYSAIFPKDDVVIPKGAKLIQSKPMDYDYNTGVLIECDDDPGEPWDEYDHERAKKEVILSIGRVIYEKLDEMSKRQKNA